jgi:hypothetical protein
LPLTRVVVHLESGGRGDRARHRQRPRSACSGPQCGRALAAKYTGEDDRQYLPDADPDFDVVYAISPQSAMMWRLADSEASQRRWTS